jgi:hypothetical protein
MRSAPAPDLLPIPGMNQGIALAAGSGGSGGSDGSAGEGGDGEGASGGSEGDDASGDNRNAPDREKYPTCGTESHPVDVVTGQVFTHPITDLHLPGPLPFTFQRSYSSTASKKDQGLGWGWAHSLGWFIEVERRRVRVWNEKGVSGRVGDRRGGVQAALGCIHRFRFRARVGFAIAPSPAPATSNRTGRFPASGSPRRRHPSGL